MNLKDKIKLPESQDELQSIGLDERKVLWERYFTRGSPLIKSLWYKIQCEKMHLKIDLKHITKLNKYSADPDKFVANGHKTKYGVKPGTEIIKTFKGEKYTVQIDSSNRFLYNGREYPTLSGLAQSICGYKVSGYDFFGLNNKNRIRSYEQQG